jgi:hypothetical protein
MGGGMIESRWASIVLPDPGGPIMRMLPDIVFLMHQRFSYFTPLFGNVKSQQTSLPSISYQWRYTPDRITLRELLYDYDFSSIELSEDTKQIIVWGWQCPLHPQPSRSSGTANQNLPPRGNCLDLIPCQARLFRTPFLKRYRGDSAGFYI